ncbi:TetR family transcriptional regulator [gamma proteobacterium BDW918]|uniref:TetR family transcriptional regulator n=1 Tax=Zhongshania aliphaticivorans TaxID=1470434 RepID=A0A127M2X3_9GAMM|nr:TetR/AcrR family transcriptional regulator [Zhongshania aliphaticivorans]AMO67574.1 TetR family transcriptional regulator [Zhongshania aliphaticivorans]EIF45028.1 TetR family transcriptional regulator [gamma proteobacterium BDW918]
MSTSEISAGATEVKPYHHGDLRRQLLDAAANLIREEGEAALSMRKLALAVGVSRTAPYHHFSDKQALLCAVAEEGFRRFRRIVTTRLDTSEPAAVIDEAAIRLFIRRYIDFAVSNAEYYDLMFGGHLWKSEQLTASLKGEAYTSFKVYVDQIRCWQKAELVSATVDPLRYAQVSWSTLHGMSRLLIDGIYLDSEAVAAMSDAAANMFWQQLQAA